MHRPERAPRLDVERYTRYYVVVTGNPAKTVSDLRAEAVAHRQEREASFERCDTDGFLSQWASGLSAQLADRQADIVESGGKSWFNILVNAETGEWVPSKLIDARYGTTWAILDRETGRFTGEFVKAFPRRRSTMTKKGYAEAKGLYPAKAKVNGRGTGLSGTAWVTTVKIVNDDLVPPSEIDLEWRPYGQEEES